MNACVIYDNILLFHTQNKVEKMFLKGQFDSLSNKNRSSTCKASMGDDCRHHKIHQSSSNSTESKLATFLYIIDVVHVVANTSQHQYPNLLINEAPPPFDLC
jgi:hypothetical protein